VAELGFKGAMIHGLAEGQFVDGKRFWPIFARAEQLDVPIYLHPAVPHPQVMDAYYKDYAQDFPTVIRAAWGYTVETATQAIRRSHPIRGRLPLRLEPARHALDGERPPRRRR
jgi:predicted TIM-barrel fold metal-dependent hydrolase